VKFGAVPVAASAGLISAHTIKLSEGVVVRKGERITTTHRQVLEAAGVADVVAATPAPDDVHEDEAASRLAQLCAGRATRVDAPTTGRCNLFADQNGVFVVDPARVHAINDVDESITLATLPPLQRVYRGDMIATVKIIPFAVPGKSLEGTLAAAAPGCLAVQPFRPLRIGVASTLLPALKASVVDKTLRILADRIAPANATISHEVRVPHEASALHRALDELVPTSDLVIVFGASAITDRRDVIPAALVEAGGRIEHLGMPVDPGNLLLLGSIDAESRTVPVLGAPGCARSPKLNGFDFVLDRILADVPVGAADIRRMGAGGLLTEIYSRPHPRVGDA
jgi:molybdenum cofactor cytidylyltransferase